MGEYIDPVARKRAIIENAKRKAAEEAAAKGAIQTTPKQMEKINYINPEDATNKLRIIADNSGSMSSQIHNESALYHAKKAMIELLRNCTPNKDAVAVHLLNQPYGYYTDDSDSKGLDKSILNSTLCTDLVQLALNIDSDDLKPTGGTPLYSVIRKAQEAKPSATRYIAFSDGQPNNFIEEEAVIQEAKKNETPIDTVYIGQKEDHGAEVMKRLASRTGGIFLLYDPSKPVNFKDMFKYLAPGKRLMLMNEEFKRKLEAGEIK